MRVLMSVSRAIDWLSRLIGVFATYLVLLAALVSAFNAVARYSLTGLLHLERQFEPLSGSLGWLLDLYRQNSNTLGEAQWYMFAAHGHVWRCPYVAHERTCSRRSGLRLGQRTHASLDRPFRQHLLPAAHVSSDDPFHLALVSRSLLSVEKARPTPAVLCAGRLSSLSPGLCSRRPTGLLRDHQMPRGLELRLSPRPHL